MRPRLFALLAIAIALPSSAQYVANTTNGVPYPALTTAAAINLVAISGTSNDRGRATIPIGFTFPYYDRTYTQITVTANGMAFFEPSSSANVGADFSFNSPIPNVSEPNALLAPFWDDLNGRNPGSLIQSQALSGPNGQGLAIEWNDWNHFLTSMYSLTFQLRIWQNGIVEFYYGNFTGNGTTLSATVGIENPIGSIATQGKSCGSACALADIQSNSLIVFGPATGPDLSITNLKINSIVTVGSNLQISTTLGLRNFGTQPANGFTYRLYLSSDTVFGAGDVELLPSPQGPLTIGALGFLDSTVSTTVPRPTTGSYYLVAVVDDANVVAESNEFNNLGATSVPLTAGVDLVAQSISGPPLGGPGEMITNAVTFSNQGIDAAGNVPLKIWLSTDNVLSANDLLVRSTSLPVTGGENVITNVSYALPLNIPAGDYYFILQIDDGPGPGVIVETSELNNVKVSAAKFTAKQADLIVDQVRVLEPLTPFGPARYAFFAEPIRLEAVVRNQGGATAPTVSVLFYLSDNDTLNGVSDPFIAQQTGLSLAPGQSLTVTLTAPLPTQAINGQALNPGSYYFFAAAVGQGLVEVSSLNNFLKSEPQAVRNPAPDLIPVTLRGPAKAGSGEALLVTRTLGNVGNRPAGPAKYRYYLSANTIITESDLLLPMRNPDGTTVDERTITLGIGEHSPGSDVVMIPNGTPEATWYLGVLIDPPGTGVGAVAEIDEENNGLAAQTIDVVPQSLGLTPEPMPGALVGLTYQFAFNGKGGTGSYTFALVPSDSLPPGLTLAVDGKVTGIPTATGSFAFSIVVTSGSSTAVERKAMRVSLVSASLSITSDALPPIVRLLAYDLPLGVQGGRAPYAWTLGAGTLPQGVQVLPSGRLVGTTSSAVGTKWTFTLQARDAVGNIDQRELSIAVVDASALLIAAAELPAGKVGSEYFVDLLAKNGGGSPVSKPLKWAVINGSLPDGVKLEPSVIEKLIISGTPVRAGVFSFTLEVEDARGRSDSADFVIRVVAAPMTIQVPLPPQLLRGDSVAAQFSVTPPLPSSVWTVRDGLLPPGLALDPAGMLAGTIPADAPFGAYTFTVAVGGPDGATAMRSYSIEVASVLTVPRRGCGCTDAPGSSWALLACVAVALRARVAKKYSRV